MQVLKAVVSAPLSAEKRPQTKRSLLEFKLPKLIALTSALSAATDAKALTYEEVLDQVPSIFDKIVDFTNENPLIVGGSVLVFAVPLILSQILSNSNKYGVESAKNAYTKLSEDADAQLLDIREVKDIRTVGSPDVKSLKKKAVAITYMGDDKQGFLKKLKSKFKEPANTTLIILDKFDGNSELVAELVTTNGFKAAYAIKDGTEGQRGWMNSGLPWLDPKKASTIDFGDIKDAISDAFVDRIQDNSNGPTIALGLAAAGVGLLAFAEIETVLQLLGSAALVQLFTKKLLFAEDRKATLKQIDEFLNIEIAPKELAVEMKSIGKALLPETTSTVDTPPAPVAEIATPSSSSQVESVDTVNVVSSVSEAQGKEESIPATPRPLSPYPFYPDFKPPSSPSPSAP